MGRILSALIALTIASAPAFVASAYVVAPAATTSTITDTITSAAKLTTTVTQMATKDATTNSPLTTASVTTTGNGAPNGSHFNLNIIGVPKDKTADLNNNNGRRIFVQLVGGNKASDINGTDFSVLSKVNTILLTHDPLNESFQVLDANATDQNGAVFQLPVDVSTKWTVWGRALGTPGGHADMTTCATVNVTDPLTGAVTTEVLCSLGTTLSIDRTKNAKFQNVTSNLLFITLDAAQQSLTTCTKATVGLFDSCLQNYFWNYDNNGLKLLQLRFYPAAAVLPGT
jgi:hypothetical protein